MLGSHKKKNPDIAKSAGNQLVVPPSPPVIPAMRTFVIRKQGWSWNEKFSVWEETDANSADRLRGVDAHGLGVDESRMASFVVFFYDELGQPTRASKLVLNADEWSEIEEINANFPTMVKH